MAADQLATMLMFTGRAEEAMNFYVNVFDDSRIDFVQHYGPDHPGPEGQVVHARFTVCGQQVLAMDSAVPQATTFTPSTSFFITCPTAEEVERLYAALVEHGSVMMDLGTYPFASRYAWVVDRFGVSWQLMAA